MSTKTKTNVILICTIAAMGGLLFGLDMGFINGSLELIKNEMNLTTASAESFASILLVGSVVGALVSGFISRGIGRKKTILISSLFFVVFTLAGSVTTSYSILYATRFCIGLSIGCASFVVPLYLSEVAPAKLRGGIVAMFQLMVTVGIFVIFLTNTAIGHYFHSWRLMLGIIAIPSIVMFIGMFFNPESPRWLMLKRRKDNAQEVLKNIRENDKEVALELNEIEESIKNETSRKISGWTLLGKGFFLKVLGLGILIQLFNTFCGINCVIYYSGQMFHAAGISNHATGTIIIGLINVFATAFAIKYVDKWGRKPIIYFGLTFMTISLLVIAYTFHAQSSQSVSTLIKVGMVGGCIVYIIAYAVSLGAIGWTLCTEIFPLEGRDFGVTITTAANYLFNAIVVAFSLTIMEDFGGATLFVAFAIVCIIGFFVIRFLTPETKGVSLEALEMNLKKGISLRNIGIVKR